MIETGDMDSLDKFHNAHLSNTVDDLPIYMSTFQAIEIVSYLWWLQKLLSTFHILRQRVDHTCAFIFCLFLFSYRYLCDVLVLFLFST